MTGHLPLLYTKFATFLRLNFIIFIHPWSINFNLFYMFTIVLVVL